MILDKEKQKRNPKTEQHLSFWIEKTEKLADQYMLVILGFGATSSFCVFRMAYFVMFNIRMIMSFGLKI